MLPECRPCCRNLMAFPANLKVDINDINKKIGKGVLLSIINHNTVPYKSLFIGNIVRIYPAEMIKQNVRSLEIPKSNGLNIYCAIVDGYTIMVCVNRNRRVVCNKRMLGVININCSKTIFNCFNCSKQEEHNSLLVKDINIIEKEDASGFMFGF